MKILIQHLDLFLRLAEETFTYEKIFDSTGVSDILKKMYIELKYLNKDYISIFYNAIRDFIGQPLYKNISLDNPKDLKFLKTDDLFKSKIYATISKIKKELDSRTVRVMTELQTYESNKKINLEKFRKIVRLDKSSLLFILDSLKEEGSIYDYNGREITTP